MVLIVDVFDEAEKYLKTEMAKDLKDFEKRNGFKVYNQTITLVKMALSDKKPINYDDFLKLRKIYNNENLPEFKALVDKCLDHLKEVFKNEKIKLFGKDSVGKPLIVDGKNYFDFAKYALRMNKDKNFSNYKSKNIKQTLKNIGIPNKSQEM